ncbi:E3 ubiquitin-protein ligase HUWE1, partial [Stegodyphus mimosarum]
MDDSLLALLPPELTSEAHALRRELEARHRQIQERFFSSHAGTALSRILRSAGRVGARYTIHSLPHRGQWTWNTLSPRGASSPSGNNSGLSSAAISNTLRLRGRYLLDNEALACLLVLLFVDEPQLNTGRLHRVLRNLCHHGPTRHWVVKSLLSILERTREYQVPEIHADSHRHKRNPKLLNTRESSGVHSASSKQDSSNRGGQPSWLSISLDAALGCRTNVFQIRRLTTAHRRANERHILGVQNVLSPNIPLVTIHPLASPVICRHVLDTLISLAKSFPIHFLPNPARREDKSKDTSNKGDQKSGKTPTSAGAKTESKSMSSSKLENSSSHSESDFWDVLVKLDSLSTTSRKGKTVLRTHSATSSAYGTSSSSSCDDVEKNVGLESSPLTKLMSFLSHPVVKRSSVLTDRLLRLLSLISLALPDPKTSIKGKSSSDFRHQITESERSLSEANTGLNSESSEHSVFTLDAHEDHPLFGSSVLAKGDTGLRKYLKLAVDVLTSKTCSEEGLEDATALLLRLSRVCLRIRRAVLFLLLDGARELGRAVCANIRALSHEMRHITVEKNPETDEREIVYDGSFAMKGTIQDRFTNSSVVINAPSKLKGRCGRELQLASMSALTSKASSQAFFLRILKVIIQLTESTQLSGKNKSLLGSDADESNSDESLIPGTSAGSTYDLRRPNSNLWSDVTNARAAGIKGQSFDPRKDPDFYNLSTQLDLDELWDALSECLTELAETPDHHAVLVLQPAVEAFFLVHASPEKENKKL